MPVHEQSVPVRARSIPVRARVACAFGDQHIYIVFVYIMSGGPKGFKAVTWGVESDWRHYGPMRISAVSVRGHESHENCADF